MRAKRRKSDWTEDIAALAALYIREPMVKALVDQVSMNPDTCWTWGNRAFPQSVLDAAGDLAELLLEPDPVVIHGTRAFQRVTYTYYPAQFLADYYSELLTSVRIAQAKAIR